MLSPHLLLCFSSMLAYLFFKFRFLVKERLVEEVKKHDVLIIVGETGSGKTTRESLFLFIFFSL